MNNGLALNYLPDDLRSDRELVLAVVRQNGFAVEHVPNGLVVAVRQW